MFQGVLSLFAGPIVHVIKAQSATTDTKMWRIQTGFRPDRPPPTGFAPSETHGSGQPTVWRSCRLPSKPWEGSVPWKTATSLGRPDLHLGLMIYTFDRFLLPCE